MNYERLQRLGDLQHAILRVLWERGEATVAEVHESLQRERERALTTIATMLSKMERRGLVDHRTEGRQFVYRPVVSEGEVARSLVSDLTRRVFDGDAAALVSHLIREREIDADELARLVRLVRARERERQSEEPERGGGAP